MTVHLWTEADIKNLRKLLPKIKNGRKTRYQKQKETNKIKKEGGTLRVRHRRPKQKPTGTRQRLNTSAALTTHRLISLKSVFQNLFHYSFKALRSNSGELRPRLRQSGVEMSFPLFTRTKVRSATPQPSLSRLAGSLRLNVQVVP